MVGPLSRHPRRPTPLSPAALRSASGRRPATDQKKRGVETRPRRGPVGPLSRLGPLPPARGSSFGRPPPSALLNPRQDPSGDLSHPSPPACTVSLPRKQVPLSFLRFPKEPSGPLFPSRPRRHRSRPYHGSVSVSKSRPTTDDPPTKVRRLYGRTQVGPVCTSETPRGNVEPRWEPSDLGNSPEPHGWTLCPLRIPGRVYSSDRVSSRASRIDDEEGGKIVRVVRGDGTVESSSPEPKKTRSISKMDK